MSEAAGPAARTRSKNVLGDGSKSQKSKSSKVATTKSFGSSKITTMETVLDFKEKEGEFKSDLEELQLEIDGYEANIKDLTNVLDAKRNEFEVLEDEEARRQGKEELKNIRKLLDEAIQQRRSLGAKAEVKIKRLLRKIDVLNDRKQIALAKIDEEANNSQELSDDEEPPAISVKGNKVQDWVDKEDFENGSLPDNKSLNTHKDPPKSKVKPDNKDPESSPKKAEEAMDRRRSDKIMARHSSIKDLPFFSGKPEDWPMFIATYRRTTEDCGFNDSENVSRLEKFLKDDAYATVKALLVSPGNIVKILERLEKRFGKPHHIIDAMIEKAKKIPAFKDDQFEPLLNFSNEISNLVAQIKVLKMDEYLKNPSLIKELEGKLPPFCKRSWSRWHMAEGKQRDLKSFADWIDEEADVVGDYCRPRSTEDNNAKKAGRSGRNNETVYAVEDKPKSFTCSLCSGSHGVWSCNDFKNMSNDEKWKVVKTKKLCLSCLGSCRNVPQCKFKERKCGLDGCTAPHHRLLHLKVASESKNTSSSSSATVSVLQPESIYLNDYGMDLNKGIVEIKLIGPTGIEVTEFALIDSGSTINVIDEDVRKQLGIEGKAAPMTVIGINESKNHPESQSVACKISGTFQNARQYGLKNIGTFHTGLGSVTQDVEELKKRHPYLRGLPLKSMKNIIPRVILGYPCLSITAPDKQVGIWNGVTAYRCKLGWYLGDHRQHLEGKVQQVMQILVDDNCDDLHQIVKKSFSIDDLGVKVIHEQPRSKEDIRAMKIMEATTRKVEDGNRYETGLLWKDPNVILPQSKQTALLRLKCQERKMDKDSDFATAYCNKMEEYLDKGFITMLAPEEVKPSEREWYLPHFGVRNPNKPGKLRLVFDAAAKSNGICLNSMLMQGPDLNNSLLEVLLKFRQYKVAIAGDIKDMFHRVLVRNEDLPSQRFLWRGMERNRDPDVYQMNVMIFGATCSPSSAQFVKNLNAAEFEDKFPDACTAIRNKFYVDDYLDFRPDDSDATRILQDVITVSKGASFVICNCTSNSKYVMAALPEELRSKDWKNMGIDTDGTERMLGLWWDNKKDEFTFKTNFQRVPANILDGSVRPTKREILKLVMSVYDPLGFLGHLIVKARILLQDVWRCGIGWDDEISEEMNGRWQGWLQELHGISKVRVPRCYSLLIPKTDDSQLHVFCDGSEQAFVTTAFLRVKFENHVDVNLVCSKVKVAPLKPISIPRLELMAAVLGARIAKSIKSTLEFKIGQTVYWTDSSTVLKWLRNDARRFKQFVSHRIGEILESTEAAEWRWVPSANNVADDATRNNKEADLSPKSRWFKGEGFLYDEEENWPVESDCIRPISNEVDPEEKVELRFAELSKFEIDFRKFKDFTALVESVALSLREEESSKPLSVFEMEAGEIHLWKVAQSDNFGEEIGLLHGGKPLTKQSKLAKLSPYLDHERVIRMRSRIESEDPIILDGSHPAVQLLIAKMHQQFGHQGKMTIANELRRNFWIIGAMRVIKAVGRECLDCQKRWKKPVVIEMGNIPKVRLESHIRPFTNTGLDYFGPMFCKEGRKSVKSWGALFTCLSVRAVHLELAGSLSTDSAIMAIDRMSNRRGRPKHIYCDNGTNFHGAANELRRAIAELDQTEIQTKLVHKRMQWHFIPPASPHMGGAWERMVGTVKKTLEGLLSATDYTREVLETFLTEVEYSVNSRPLTNVSTDPDDPRSITPNDFLLSWQSGVPGDRVNYQLQGNFEESDMFRRQQWKKPQVMADCFWKRWIREYRTTLMKRTKWHKSTDEIKVGDHVIIVDEQAKRNTWVTGMVMAIYPGKDSKTRMWTSKPAMELPINDPS